MRVLFIKGMVGGHCFKKKLPFYLTLGIIQIKVLSDIHSAK